MRRKTEQTSGFDLEPLVEGRLKRRHGRPGLVGVSWIDEVDVVLAGSNDVSAPSQRCRKPRLVRMLTLGGVDWGNYKTEVVANTDYRKFDDTLRMVLDSTADQRARLELALEARWQRRELVYGIHVAKEALMTCLIFDRRNSHTHFVDGAEGGYALAAQRMKAQLAE